MVRSGGRGATLADFGLRFPAAGSMLGSTALCFALEAAVAAVARVSPLVALELVAAVAALAVAGLERVAIREGRALAFSLSLAIALRVARVVRLV
jgi:hypothetical protein